MVRMKNAKMAKSTGNVFTLSEALSSYSGEVVRYFFLSAHYRSPLDYNENSLQEAASSLNRLYSLLRRIQVEISSFVPGQKEEVHSRIEQLSEEFISAMDDDFNTPVALSILFQMTREANLVLANPQSQSSRFLLAEIARKIKYLGHILGLFQAKEENKLEGKEDQLVRLLIDTRDRLREKKDWEVADQVRKGLDRLGIKLEDRENRTVWRTS